MRLHHLVVKAWQVTTYCAVLYIDWKPEPELLDALAAEAQAKLSDFTPQVCTCTPRL